MSSISTTNHQRAWYSLYAAGAIAVLVFWWRATGSTTSATAGSLELALGNVTGLLGTYAVLWQLVLLSRLTFLERAFGLERLTQLHKWNGYIALIALILHAILLTFAFAWLDHTGLIAQFVNFLTNWEDLLKATIGLLMLIGIVFISIGIVRRGFKYETWYYVHFTTYLAILLGFSHQLSVGSDFVNNRPFEVFWIVLYLLAIGVIGWWRFVWPTYLVYKHRFVVSRIVPETPTMTSIYITGRHLEQFRYEAGQFVIWRFLARGFWWQAHPFSLSVAPGGEYLRLTAKAVGDFTQTLRNQLQPGTLVSVDGPHGAFTPSRLSRRSPKLLLIAGGSGITPIRAMLEQLPPHIRDVVVIYAVSRTVDLALRSEIEALAAKHGYTLRYLLSQESAPGLPRGTLDDAHLRRLAPDAASREVMLCGPPAMMDSVTAGLLRQGVPRRHIHTERFAY